MAAAPHMSAATETRTAGRRPERLSEGVMPRMIPAWRPHGHRPELDANHYESRMPPARGSAYHRGVDEAAGRPILGLWRSWRGLGLDVAVASLATWLNLFEAFYAPPGPVLQTTSDMVVLTVAAGAVLLLRRRFPVAVALIAVAATAIGRTFLPEIVGLYTMASFTRS